MPRISLQCLRVNLTCYFLGYLKNPFFEQYTHYCGYEGNESRTFQSVAIDDGNNILYSVPSQHDGYDKQCHSDNGSCHSLIFSMTVVMILVRRLAAQLDKCYDYNVRKEIAQRMDGICNHRSRVAQ